MMEWSNAKIEDLACLMKRMTKVHCQSRLSCRDRNKELVYDGETWYKYYSSIVCAPQLVDFAEESKENSRILFKALLEKQQTGYDIFNNIPPITQEELNAWKKRILLSRQYIFDEVPKLPDGTTFSIT